MKCGEFSSSSLSLPKEGGVSIVRNLLIPVLIFAIALWYRLEFIQGAPLSWDEVEYWHRSVTGEGRAQLAPLGPFLNRLWLQTFGTLHKPEDIRLPAIFFGALAPLPVYALCRRCLNWRIACIAGLLIAMHPTLVGFSSFARPYGLLCFLTGLALFLYYLLIERLAFLRGVLFLGVVTLLFQTHLLVLPFVAVLSIGWCWHHMLRFRETRDRATLLKAFAFQSLVVLFSFLGSVWVLFRQDSVTTVLEGAYGRSVWHFVVSLGTIISGLRPAFNVKLEVSLFDVLCGLSCLILIGLGATALRKKGAMNLLFACIASSLALYLVLFLTLGRKSNWPWGRYIAHSLVPLSIPVCAGVDLLLTRFLSFRWQLTATFGAIALFVLCFPVSAWFFSPPGGGGIQYRRAVKTLEKDSTLTGVIFRKAGTAYGDETERLLAYWHLYGSGGSTPLFVLRRAGIFAVGKKERNGVSYLSEGAPVVPPNGRYAVFSRGRKSGCDLLKRSTHVMQASEVTLDMEKPSKVAAVCSIAFKKGSLM